MFLRNQSQSLFSKKAPSQAFENAIMNFNIKPNEKHEPKGEEAALQQEASMAEKLQSPHL